MRGTRGREVRDIIKERKKKNAAKKKEEEEEIIEDDPDFQDKNKDGDGDTAEQKSDSNAEEGEGEGEGDGDEDENGDDDNKEGEEGKAVEIEQHWIRRKFSSKTEVTLTCKIPVKVWKLGDTIPLRVKIQHNSPKFIKHISIFFKTTYSFNRLSNNCFKDGLFTFVDNKAFPLKDEVKYKTSIDYNIPKKFTWLSNDKISSYNHFLVVDLPVKRTFGFDHILCEIPIKLEIPSDDDDDAETKDEEEQEESDDDKQESSGKEEEEEEEEEEVVEESPPPRKKPAPTKRNKN